jgi:hypothetical protein
MAAMNANISNARLADMAQIREHLSNILTPVPAPDTLRALFKRARIPQFKSNPLAVRGGGRVFYSVPHVEKLFRSQLAPARLTPLSINVAA